MRLRWQRNDEPGRNASHGWLNDNGQLVLLQPPLRRQLEQCPGYAAWRASGSTASPSGGPSTNRISGANASHAANRLRAEPGP